MGSSIGGGGVGGSSIVGGSSSSYLAAMRPPDYLFMKYVLSDTGSARGRRPITSPVSVTSLTFDQQEELLWTGNERGHVTSYFGLWMSKYTSFQVHADHDVRSQLATPFGLLSLTKSALRLSIRRGLTVFDHTSDHLRDMYCMARTENPSVILMAGQQSELLEFDLQHVKPIRVTQITDADADPASSSSSSSSAPSSTGASSGCMIIRNHPKFVCCGDASGKVSLRACV